MKKKKMSKLLFWEAVRGYLFIAPALILLVGLLFIPMVHGFWYSVTDFNILKSWEYHFTGLSNFKKLLANENFGIILKNEIIFAVVVTSITVVISMIFAIFLNLHFITKN